MRHNMKCYSVMYVYDPARDTRCYQRRWTFEQKKHTSIHKEVFVGYCLGRPGGETHEQTGYSKSWRTLQSHEPHPGSNNLMRSPWYECEITQWITPVTTYTPEQTGIVWPRLFIFFCQACLVCYYMYWTNSVFLWSNYLLYFITTFLHYPLNIHMCRCRKTM